MSESVEQTRVRWLRIAEEQRDFAEEQRDEFRARALAAEQRAEEAEKELEKWKKSPRLQSLEEGERDLSAALALEEDRAEAAEQRLRGAEEQIARIHEWAEPPIGESRPPGFAFAQREVRALLSQDDVKEEE